MPNYSLVIDVIPKNIHHLDIFPANHSYWCKMCSNLVQLIPINVQNTVDYQMRSNLLKRLHTFSPPNLLRTCNEKEFLFLVICFAYEHQISQTHNLSQMNIEIIIKQQNGFCTIDPINQYLHSILFACLFVRYML